MEWGNWVTALRNKKLTNEEVLGRKKRVREALKEEEEKETFFRKVEEEEGSLGKKEAA